MSTLSTYSFLPWLRQGIANTIQSADGDSSVKTRATAKVEVQLKGDPIGGGAALTQNIDQDIALYGPGDIIGIDPRAIVRTDPRPWVTNFESNYLAAIEFYDEDFPWRYTPAAPDGSGLRLRPWLTLIVLDESEFDEGKNALDRPLPYISVHDLKSLPLSADLWAWAHVHFNQSLAGSPKELVSPDMGAVLPRVKAIVGTNPDQAYARIVCPRRLAENTGYHAFVIPTFETGRLAGLGLDPARAPFASASAWGGGAEPNSFPVYYRWFFQTGSKGDFEYLVRLLKPQSIDARVGFRDMDVKYPGSNIPAIDDPKLKGVLRLGGALQVPDADLGDEDLKQRRNYDQWDQLFPVSFQTQLAAFINLPDDYAHKTAPDANASTGIDGIAGYPDPLITAPLYGRWHSLTQRLLTEQGGTPAPNATKWVHKLNLDPRFRVPAAFGAQVVESNAELYMNYAWEQIGDVLAANQKIRHLQLATEVSGRWHDRHLTPLAAVNGERALTMTSPVATRVLTDGQTVHYTQTLSIVPPTLTSTVMRRVTRPGARLMRQLPFDGSVTPQNLLTRINAGEVSAAPPKQAPPGLPTVDQAGQAAHPPGVPIWLLAVLAAYPWLPFAVAAAGVLLAILIFLLLWPGGLSLALAVGGGLVALAIWLWRLRLADGPAQAIQEANQTPDAVANLPSNPTFVLGKPGSGVSSPPGTIDSPDAVRFKTALRDSFVLQAAAKAAAQRPAPSPLNLTLVKNIMVDGVNPRVTIPKRGLTLINIPLWIRGLISEEFSEVMAYPRIDLPMYDPLKKISVELFLPNLNLIAPNSITLIETNQKFIESYMVGLNHEFARKLLWRGYPTDQRGSYFRQFWDVRSVIDNEGLSGDPLKEKLYDIPPLHLWPPDSELGSHNNRASAGEKGEQAVLVIRGELLKKYPTAVIYAQHAKWARTSGNIDPDLPRELDQPCDAEAGNPPRDKIRIPLYEAKADPDIYFFGFDLTVPEAKGGTGQNPTDDPGWFFVIKERPGEPRFGLEIERDAGAPTVFDHLTWDDAISSATPGQFLPAGSLANVAFAPPPLTEVEQQSDDLLVNAAPQSSARWAYLLFRSPVMVAVHADEMLK